MRENMVFSVTALKVFRTSLALAYNHKHASTDCGMAGGFG
jgi:hypothetical protein